MTCNKSLYGPLVLTERHLSNHMADRALQYANLLIIYPAPKRDRNASCPPRAILEDLFHRDFFRRGSEIRPQIRPQSLHSGVECWRQTCVQIWPIWSQKSHANHKGLTLDAVATIDSPTSEWCIFFLVVIILTGCSALLHENHKRNDVWMYLDVTASVQQYVSAAILAVALIVVRLALKSLWIKC